MGKKIKCYGHTLKFVLPFELQKIFKFHDSIPDGEPSEEYSSTDTDPQIPLQNLLMRARREGYVTGLFVEMEICDTTLDFWLKANNISKPITNTKQQLIQEQVKLIRGIIRGMKYLQENKIMHCDLKPDNILIKREPGKCDGKLSVKIADFGLSMYIPVEFDQEGNLNEKTISIRGNMRYRAPELLFKSSATYSLQSEIYSVGMIISEIVTVSTLPLRGKPRKVFDTLATKLSKFEGNNKDVKMFVTSMGRMLQENSNIRMDCAEFLNLDFDWCALSSEDNFVAMENVFAMF